jgi:hypothetical protein
MLVRNWVTGLVLSAVAITLGACGSSTDGDTGSAVGPAGCSQAPDCSLCGECFDTCLCASGDAEACLAQCTSGTGGASTGGTGNVGGGGAGGTPTGGTGGGSGGGLPTGGTGGGSGGGGNCDGIQTGSAQCDACLQSSCCSQIEACFGDQACLGLLQCLTQYCSQTSNVQACAQQNCSQYFGGANAYNAIGQCAQSSCPACG